MIPPRPAYLVEDRPIPYFDLPGAGRPVVFVHGLGVDSGDWAEQASRLAGRHRALGLDLRGHGRAAPSPEGYDPRLLASDVAAWLDGVGVSGALLVGHSLGAVIVSHVAVERPELVAALLVLDPAYGNTAGHYEQVRRWIDRLRADTDSSAAVSLIAGSDGDPAHRHVDDFVAERVRSTSPEMIWRALHDLHFSDQAISVEPAAGNYLRRRRQPVLAVNRKPHRARWEASLLSADHAHPASISLAWTDSGHFLHLTHPDRFGKLLRSWLEHAGIPS